MEGSLTSLLSLAGIAAALSLIGGLLPLRFDAGDRLRGSLLYLAAGMLLGVVVTDLWPEIGQQERTRASIVGLVGGALFMVALNGVTRRIERRGGSDLAKTTGLATAALLDSLVDGALIGIGYVADPTLGLLLAGGVGVEKFTVNMTLAAEMRRAGCSARRLLLIVGVIAATLVPAAAAGMVLIADVSPTVMAGVLAAATAVLIYLVTMELAVRGRDAQHDMGTVACFFAGFVAIAAVQVLAPA